MAKGAERHDNCGYCDKSGCQCTDFLRGIVDLREKSAHKKHAYSYNDTAKNTEHNHFIIRILGFFQFAGTQILSHHNADAGTKLDINDVEQIGDGRSNVKSGNYFQAADRITLYYGCHSGSPQNFIHHKW